MTWAAAYLNELPGCDLPGLTSLPFFGLLLSIALMPLLVPKFWHKNENFVLAFWGTLTTFIVYQYFGSQQTAHAIFSVVTGEYIPFVAVLTTLYTVSSHVKITVTGNATPYRNVKFLFFGSILASFIGTTGAAMLLIRPFLAFNKDHHHKAPLVIFFIFLVANIGGCLTPLGDPPLFLGFLYGVKFFWPAQFLILPFLMVFSFVLATFWVLDAQFYKMRHGDEKPEQKDVAISVQGKRHLAFIPFIIGLILTSSYKLGQIHIGPHIFENGALIRDFGLVFIIGASFLMDKLHISDIEKVSFAPVKEVLCVFLSIFVSMIPITVILKAGEAGDFANILAIANPGGDPSPFKYFWMTGLFSGFLDNAPTYSLFFKMAGGNPQELMTTGRLVLEAISLGAVFFGAITYIGNAPNFMVRSIAKQYGVEMPSFFGYMAWSFAILTPIFLVFSLVWFF